MFTFTESPSIILNHYVEEKKVFYEDILFFQLASMQSSRIEGQVGLMTRNFLESLKCIIHR